jgi:hypothetical protein
MQLIDKPMNGKIGQATSRMLTNGFYSTTPNEFSQQVRLQNRSINLFNNNQPDISIKNSSTFFPALEKGISQAEYPVKEINGELIMLSPSLHKSLKQAAIRLSDVEMSIYNNDLKRLEFATLILKNIFIDINIPSAYRLTLQLEELANENKMKEVYNVLQAIKKIIAMVVHYMQQLTN